MSAYTTNDDYIVQIIRVLVVVGLIYSIYLAGRIAERRGRSFKTWAWVAAGLLGPLALPLLFLLPNLRRRDPGGPNGEKRADVIDAVKPAIPGNPNPSHFRMSFVERLFPRPLGRTSAAR
jgi:hypothetical protein